MTKWICFTCGEQAMWYDMRHKPKEKLVATVHFSTCECCGREDIGVTSARKFGWPDFTKIPNDVMEKIKKGELD